MSPRRDARGLVALVATSLLLMLLGAPAAQARRIYINVELNEEYYASLPGGEHWGSVGDVSAYYKTTSQALSAGDGSLQISPTKILGTFKADLVDPGGPSNCKWGGDPGGGHQLAELFDGTPFAGSLVIQWPGYPGMWDQMLSSASTGSCGPAFQSNPFEGNVKWAIGNRTMSGGGMNRFVYAAAPRNRQVESQRVSAAITAVTMTSLRVFSANESYTVTAEGVVIESTVPFSSARNVLPQAALPTSPSLPAPLSAKALHNLGLKALPKKIPKGCVLGQRHRRHRRCP